MRILFITAGAGRMACDACLRDGALSTALTEQGHEVVSVATYTPPPASGGRAGERPLFYGGINVFLQQKFSLFRHTPHLLDQVFDSRWLLDFVSRFGHLTQARDLAELTLSVLAGEDGHQRKELENLLGWIERQPRFDLALLPNSMLAALAGPIRRLGLPVFCLLSGEDMFIDAFPEPYRARTVELLRRRAREIDQFLVSSSYYAAFMSRYLDLAPEKIRIAVAGVDCAPYADAARAAPEVFTIGFRSQIHPPNGLHHLVEAFRRLKRDPATAACRLHVAGYLGPADRDYFKRIVAGIKADGLHDSFEYAGNPDPRERVGFLEKLSVLSVPVVYPEPTGIFVPEALAAGVPIIAPRTGCLPEWIEATGGGLLVEAGQPADLAAGLARLMRDPPLAQRLGAAGRAAVLNRFTTAHMARSIVAIMTDFLGRNKAARS